MALTGQLTLVLAVLLWSGSLVVAYVAWGRGGGTRVRAALRRAGLLVLCQLTAIAVVGVLVNDANSFYTSWREFLGEHHHVTSSPATPGQADAALTTKLRTAGSHGHGLMVPIRIPGVHSHLPALSGYIYLPPQYGAPEYATRQFPVVELLAGSPGSPRTWIQGLHIGDILDAEITSGRTEPFVAVIPDVDVAGSRDTECVNVHHGPQVETYLTADVRAAITHDFRVSADGRGWSLMGYSSGGYCAVNLAMRSPAMFGSAVSIAGYDRPYQDAQTGKLFADTHERDLNSPIWRATHLPPVNVSVLMLSSASDPGTARAASEMTAAAHAPLEVTRVQLSHGGHNFEVWRAELPVALGWLSRHVTPPLAPAPVIDGLRPVTSGGN